LKKSAGQRELEGAKKKAAVANIIIVNHYSNKVETTIKQKRNEKGGGE